MSKQTPEDMSEEELNELAKAWGRTYNRPVFEDGYQGGFKAGFKQAITREREAQAELERKLGIALSVLIHLSVSEFPLSYFAKPVRPFIQLARDALSEINAKKEGE